MAVAQHLHLDVARAAHQALDVHIGNAEGGQRLAPAAFVGGGKIGCVFNRAHAAPATTAHGLDNDAVRGMLREEVARLIQRDRVRHAGHQRHAAALRQVACGGLVAEQRQLIGCRADEAHAHRRAVSCEVGALGEKTVAGVQRVATVLKRNGDQPRAIQVRRRPAGAQRHRRVGRAHMRRLRVVVGVHRDARHTQIAQGAHDAQRHLATVGHQNLVEHDCFQIRSCLRLIYLR